MTDITELTDIEAERVDGVTNPASGFPFLLIKAIDEPAEKASGCGCCDACQWDADSRMTVKEAEVYKRDVSADERKKLASEGHALSDGSYPIANEGDLHNAAHLAKTGHGNVAAAKRLIARRAKELGVANPLDEHEDTKKEAEVVTEPEADETPAADEAVDKGADDLDARIQEAVTKARESDQEAIRELRDELAKVKATPLPGGPAVTAPAGIAADKRRTELLKEAAYYDKMAEQISEQDMKVHYRAKATAAREAAKA